MERRGPPVGTIAELLADAASTERLVAADGKSGALMECVVIDGERYVVKYLCLDDDWIMRVTEDHHFRPMQLWEWGIHDDLPSCIDDATVAIGFDDPDDEHPTGRLALLMRDVGSHLVPEGHDLVPLDQHRRFLSHMAQLHAAFWNWRDEIGLWPLDRRYLWFAPAVIAPEAARENPSDPVRFAPVGWRRLEERAPDLYALVTPLHADPSPLVKAVADTPQTLVHGDWKMGNLGSHPDGRTVLIDWAVCGAAPGWADLTHYLSLNRARLPESKERASVAYRDALEQCGIDTEPWWDRQRSLSLLGGMVQFGWEKALGEGEESDDELAWWTREAIAGARWLR